MSSAADVFVLVVCYLLVGLTAWETGRGWLRYRDRHRLDILLVVGQLVVILLFGERAMALAQGQPVFAFIFNLIFLAQPYFLFRLVERFHRVHNFIWALAIASPFAGAMAASNWPMTGPTDWTAGVAIYFTLQLSYAGWAFSREAQRASGVAGARLWFAALGTWLHVAIAVIFGLEHSVPALAAAGPSLRHLLGVGVFACYYAGLVAPRQLRLMWEQRELYRHIRDGQEQPPDVRALRAADDLCRAVGQGVVSIARAVLLFDEARPDVLRTVASSDPALGALIVRPALGLVGQSLQRGAAAAGRARDCEPELAEVTRRLGRSVWSVPIGTADRQWGVLIVVQQYGSLFPGDDLEFIEVLCRQATLTLDHARLIEAERAMQQRSAALRLRDSEVRFARILESIRDYAVLLVNDAGAILAWKAGADAVFGATAELMIGASAAPLYRRSDEAFRALLAEARQTGYLDDENPCQRHDGAVFFASTTIRPIHEQSVGLSGFVVVTRDETERRALAERLQQTQKMEAVGQLAGGVAHDFNNLLTAVLGYAAIIESHPGYDRALDEHLVEIRRIAERATALTRRLLAFSRRQVVQPRLVNLADIVHDLVAMLDRVLEDRVQVDFRAETEAWILADPVQIEQVVLNLAVNARDAMPSGGTIDMRTTTTTLEQPTMVGDALLSAGVYSSLTVADRGVGMDAATMARIFEPFFTTKDIGRGTGLGLSTVYGIVKQMGGGIGVVSAPGKGTAFTVLLPSAEAEVPAVASPGATDERLEGNETILVAEDDDAIRPLIASWLEKRGYRVILASHPAQARAAMAGAPHVDLVISDVIMPGDSGPTLVRELQQQRPGLPALYISGYAHATLTTEGHLSPGTNFLEKPFTEVELLRRVRSILTSSARGRDR